MVDAGHRAHHCRRGREPRAEGDGGGEQGCSRSPRLALGPFHNGRKTRFTESASDRVVQRAHCHTNRRRGAGSYFLEVFCEAGADMYGWGR